ncbi:MAG: F0F1 ATP synthase subunit epsilon [Betaproteobacteria bacterium]|nr:F0F1 ATP synthase subunit epsilon [Betaproteobacteria bacterium]
MSMTMQIEIVSAESTLFTGMAEYVIVPGEMGELGIYPRHTQLLSRLKAGSVRVKLPDTDVEELIYVSGGMLEVQPHVVIVLADTAIRGHDLDEAKALEAKRRAEEAMKNRASAFDYAQAQAELAQAIAQIATIQRLRKLH